MSLEGIRFRANLECEDERDYLHAEEDRDILLAALDAVLALTVRLDASPQCEDREIADDICAAINTALDKP